MRVCQRNPGGFFKKIPTMSYNANISNCTFQCVANFNFWCCSPNLLFGMGNPLLDICAVVDKDFLDK